MPDHRGLSVSSGGAIARSGAGPIRSPGKLRKLIAYFEKVPGSSHALVDKIPGNKEELCPLPGTHDHAGLAAS